MQCYATRLELRCRDSSGREFVEVRNPLLAGEGAKGPLLAGAVAYFAGSFWSANLSNSTLYKEPPTFSTFRM